MFSQDLQLVDGELPMAVLATTLGERFLFQMTLTSLSSALLTLAPD